MRGCSIITIYRFRWAHQGLAEANSGDVQPPFGSVDHYCLKQTSPKSRCWKRWRVQGKGLGQLSVEPLGATTRAISIPDAHLEVLWSSSVAVGCFLLPSFRSLQRGLRRLAGVRKYIACEPSTKTFAGLEDQVALICRRCMLPVVGRL